MTKKLKPESLMMSYGYKPELSEGAIKCPIFQTSTFVFKTAEEGKHIFEVAGGKTERLPDEQLGLFYSRINNPDLEILENRLCLWDEAEECAVFESGMSAISTVLLEFLRPGDLMLYSTPLYGGTDHFIHHFLTDFGIEIMGFKSGEERDELIGRLERSGAVDRLKLIYVETPANPTNDLIDIAQCRSVAEHFSTPGNEVVVVVDNTYMGPLWQHPLQHGAHLVLYSATKYIGGHSDIIAGAVLGNSAHMKRVKKLRNYLGNMAGPWTGWLLMRSLETLKIRMEKQQRNAKKVARYLKEHPKVRKVNYLGLIPKDTEAYKIYKKQCSGSGAMISFEVLGGEKEAFKVLNAFRLIKLAVSLGSTESLAEHPRTMTHSNVDEDDLNATGISESLIRLSVGVEHHADLISDLEQALEVI